MNKIKRNKKLIGLFPILVLISSLITGYYINLVSAEPTMTEYNHYENEEDVSLLIMNPILSDIDGPYYRNFFFSITHKKNQDRIYPLGDDNYPLKIKEIQIFFLYLSDEETYPHGSIYTEYALFTINYSEPQVLYFGDALEHQLQLPDQLSDAGEFINRPTSYNSYRCIIRLYLQHIYDAELYDETFYLIKYDGFVTTTTNLHVEAFYNAISIALISTVIVCSIAALVIIIKRKNAVKR